MRGSLGMRGWESTVGRSSRTAKLTEQQAKEIYALQGTGQKATEVAKRYGVSSETIGGIWRKKYWQHLRHTCEECGQQQDVQLYCSVPIRLCPDCAAKRDWYA